MTVLRYIYLFIFCLGWISAYSQDTIPQKSCIDCHNKIIARTVVHKPVQESCISCHKSNGTKHPVTGEKGFVPVVKPPELCYSCHTPVNTKPILHSPVKKGHCQYCHDAHGSKRKNILVSASPDLCFVCHSELEKKVDTSKIIHGILKNSVSCSNCHSPHQSNEKRLLITTEKDLCLKCHNKTIKQKENIIANIKNELTNNKFIHGAILKDGCSGCHDPHASQQNSLLKDFYTTSTYITGNSKNEIALCFKCHNAGLLMQEKSADVTGFRNGEKNLHFIHVNKSKGRNCVNCHGIHSGPNEFLLVNKVKFGQWEMPMKFSKTLAGGSCITSCHTLRSYTR